MQLYKNLMNDQSHKPTKNYHPSLQFSSGLWSILASFSSFWFYNQHLNRFDSLSPLLSTLLPYAAGTKNTTCTKITAIHYNNYIIIIIIITTTREL